MEIMEMTLKLTGTDEIRRVMAAVYGLDPAELDQLRKAAAAEAQQKEESAAEMQQVVKEDPAEPEKANPGRPKSLDKGKIIALYRAGWTVAKIADEMKCSTTSVYNITHKQ